MWALAAVGRATYGTGQGMEQPVTDSVSAVLVGATTRGGGHAVDTAKRTGDMREHAGLWPRRGGAGRCAPVPFECVALLGAVDQAVEGCDLRAEGTEEGGMTR